MQRIVLGLGANLGDKEKTLKDAIALLQEHGLTNVRVSSLYESDALLPPGAPQSWNIPYYNIAVAGMTTLTPQELLQTTQKIERMLGRKDNHEFWSPREIDIDILAYGDDCVNDENLIIPHAHLAKRIFALQPFSDIWPDWKFPSGQSLTQAIAALPESNKKGLRLVKAIW